MIRSFNALRRAAVLVCLPLACAGVTACGGSDGGAGDDLVDVSANGQPTSSCEARGTCASTPASGAPGSTTGTTGTSGGATAADGGAAPTTPATPPTPAADGGTTSTPVDATLSDGQIFAILLAANDGEIAEGRLAKLKSPRSEVRDFADALVEDHEEARKAEIDLAFRLHVLPLGNDVSHALEQDTAQALLRLTPMDGDTFDPAFVGGEITAHQDLLSIIDAKLLPSVESATLRAHIALVRAEVQAHLTRAVVLRATLP